MNCILGRKPGKDRGCAAGSCKGCGWNPKEMNRRERLLTRDGLQMCSDGLRRLILSEKGAVSGKRAAAAGGETKKREQVKILKTCENCGKEFLTGGNNQKYCCGACRVAATKRKRREKRQEEKFSV